MIPADLYKLVGVGLYLSALLVIGFLASRRMHSLRDYVVADKKLGFVSVAFSARATGESAWLLLGLTGMGAAVGLRAFWVVAGEVIGVAGAWLLLARRFKRITDRHDSITVPDYLEARFGDESHLLRRVAAAALVVFVTIYVSAQIDATGKAFETFLQWDYFLGALIGFVVVLLYTTGGGFLAVVWSDVFQGTMMLLGLVTLPIMGIVGVGGLNRLFAELHGLDPALLTLSGQEGWNAGSVAGAIALSAIGMGFLGSPQIFVRFLALRSEREIGRGAGVAIAWTVLCDSGAVLVGMLGRVLLGVESEEVLPNLVEHLLPAFFVGIYMAIVLAAIMSTADSLLVVASSAAVRDWYQKVRRPDLSDEALVSTSRLATLLIALLALAVALLVAVLSPSRTIFWFVVFGWSGIAATFCPTIILSLFWPGFSMRGALAAMVTGFVSVPLFKFGAPHLPIWGPFFAKLEELFPAFLLSLLTGTLVSLGESRRRPPK